MSLWHGHRERALMYVQSAAPYLPPAPRWPDTLPPQASPPRLRPSCTGVWLFPRDADPGSRPCLARPPPQDVPHHLGPSEEAQCRTEQGYPALIHAGSSSLSWDDFRYQSGLTLSSGRLLGTSGKVEQGSRYHLGKTSCGPGWQRAGQKGKL